MTECQSSPVAGDHSQQSQLNQASFTTGSIIMAQEPNNSAFASSPGDQADASEGHSTTRPSADLHMTLAEPKNDETKQTPTTAQDFPITDELHEVSNIVEFQRSTHASEGANDISDLSTENFQAFTRNGEVMPDFQPPEYFTAMSAAGPDHHEATIDDMQLEFASRSPSGDDDSKNNKRSVSVDTTSPTESKRTKSSRATPTRKQPTRNAARGVSTNKKINPTERPALYVNPGGTVVNGPFTAYHRPLPPPAPLIDDSLRSNPYLQEVMESSMSVSPASSQPEATPIATATVEEAMSGHFLSPAISPQGPTPKATSTSIPKPVLLDWQELRDYLHEKHEELIKVSREAGVLIHGRERDRVFNRTAKVPNLTIEVRLKGIEGFKEECKAWNTAMEHHALLKRRDFYRERIGQVDKIIEKLETE